MNNERILIVGGTGSLGKTLIKRYVNDNLVCVFSRDESKHWTIKNQIKSKNLKFFIGDIRDKQRCLESIINFKPTQIILASALKHVDVCERSPSESIKTNILGIQNFIDCIKGNVSKFKFIKTVLMVSTDKACSPINVYGMCKSIAERIVTSCSTIESNIKFVAVRYGNVLESRGSIIPLFKYQSENNDFITVTDKRMTRYVMTLDESVDLIEAAIINGKTGETWIPELPAMSIQHLAEIFSDISKKEVRYVGMRPGEKLHEDLINESESMRCRVKGKYRIIESAHNMPFSNLENVMKSNMSVMKKEELKRRLEDLNILNKPFEKFVGKSIEEIRK